MKQGLKLIWKGIKKFIKAYCNACYANSFYNWNIYGRNYSADVK